MKIPPQFVQLVTESLGERASKALIDSLEKAGEEEVVSVRVNPAKSLGGLFAEVESEPVPFAPYAYYLNRRINFTLDPSFHTGAYYVQDASSMFPAVLEDTMGTWLNEYSHLNAHSGDFEAIKEPLKVLDLCASPGGKSTHMLSILNEFVKENKLPDFIFFSNEAVRKRVPALQDNIAKWGFANTVVTNNFAQQYAQGLFDIIIADVPCSGEGMFRKSEAALQGWSIETVRQCASLQREIIEDVWPSLKEGGLLIYSTCTYNHYENADNVKFIADNLGAQAVALSQKVPGLLVIEDGMYQFVPGLVRGEGQFFAVLQKRGPAKDRGFKGEQPVRSSGKEKDSKGAFKELRCSKLHGYTCFAGKDGIIRAYPKQLAEQMIRAASQLKAVASGIAVAQIKGKDLVPEADFALSLLMQQLLGYDAGSNAVTQNPENRKEQNRVIQIDFASSHKEAYTLRFAVWEVGREEALRFLRKETLLLKEAPLGYILLTYRGLGLGFVKNIGSRTNNLHPQGRRIFT